MIAYGGLTPSCYFIFVALWWIRQRNCPSIYRTVRYILAFSNLKDKIRFYAFHGESRRYILFGNEGNIKYSQ